MLKVLLLRNKLDTIKKNREALEKSKDELKTREAELETAINEMAADTTEEDRKVVSDKVDALEKDKEDLEAKAGDLDHQIKETEDEIAEAEKNDVPAEPAPETKQEERKGDHFMNRKFFDMNIQERDAFFAKEETKGFLTDLRGMLDGKEKRAVTGAALTIPEYMLPLVQPIIDANSKLKKYANLSTAKGTGRQPVMGTIPTAIWVESTAAVGELALAFNSVMMDCYKCCGFLAVPNSIVEDSDEDLITEFFQVLGAAIGKGYDKAIVYGTGSSMPMGFVTRLAQATKPATYPANARTWVDLHTSNVLTLTGKTGADLFAAIAKALKACKNDYFQDGLIWVMNENTRLDLIAESIGKNSNALLVAGMNSNVMPVIGGAIETEGFMADGDIAFGYAKGYSFQERKGVQLTPSTEAKFIEDQTVVKGTARADGQPVIAEAFGILNIAGTAPTTTVTF